MSDPFYIKEAEGEIQPILISIPHCGTEIPADLVDDYVPEQLASLDDTDWFLQQLYAFAPSIGITIIHAKYSRWLIDLNRDPESVPLYNDGRLITGLCSTTDFLGNPLYKDGKAPSQEEVERRLKVYYWPYYQKIQEELDKRKAKFGKALLWDAHSIREKVETIRKDPFPEMILGNNEEKTANKQLIETTLKNLRTQYQVNHNDPFKGGHITRYFGKPEDGIHALQLERNKNLYMDDSERNYHPERANEMAQLLSSNFKDLLQLLHAL